jgi:anti-anti-sigma factor
MDRVSVDLRVPGIALVALSGEHELYDALKLREQFHALFGEGLSVVVDMTETVFVDSTIVGVLLAGYSVVLGETTGDAVRRMFEMTGLLGILPVVERDAPAAS